MNTTDIEALLICNSNMFITTVLTEVLANPEKNYLVISDTENIKTFFEFLSIPNVIFIEYGRKGRFDFIKKRHRLYRSVIHYNLKKIIFFHTEYGEMANWLIMKLSKIRPVLFCKVFDKKPSHPSKELLKSLKIKVFQMIYWNMHVDVLYDFRSFPSLPDSFYRKYSRKTIEMPINLKMVSSYVSKRLSDINIKGKYILLTGTVVRNGMYGAIEYEDFINEIIDIIGVKELVSKCHPRFKDLYGKEKELLQVPSYVPGSVLMDNFDYYIGFESTLLAEVASYGKIAVSLIDWLKPNETKRVEIHKLLDSRTKSNSIFYPQNKDEFISLLA